MSSWPMLLLGFAIVVECGREALLDRTPRKPFEWRRPNIEWWAVRHSPTEWIKHTVRVRNRRWPAATRSGGK